jgi:predicted ATP-dependent Lon-type protease
MSLGGNIVPVENLAESLQVGFDAGAKRLLLPMASVKDIPTIPGELFASSRRGFTLMRPMRCSRHWEWGDSFRMAEAGD